jgi:uncharacterized protein YjiS (DUF1127 family)
MSGAWRFSVPQEATMHLSFRIASSAAMHGTQSAITLCSRLAGLAARWRAQDHFRNELRRLQAAGPHLLADIGMTNAESEIEKAKRFWEA